MVSEPPKGRSFQGQATLGLWILGGLVATGVLLHWVGSSFGAPEWTGWLLVLGGAAALAVYLWRVFPVFRRFGGELPSDLARWGRFEGEISDAFEQLGAGDLVRALERTAGLPQRLAAMFHA